MVIWFSYHRKQQRRNIVNNQRKAGAREKNNDSQDKRINATSQSFARAHVCSAVGKTRQAYAFTAGEERHSRRNDIHGGYLFHPFTGNAATTDTEQNNPCTTLWPSGSALRETRAATDRSPTPENAKDRVACWTYQLPIGSTIRYHVHWPTFVSFTNKLSKRNHASFSRSNICLL